MMNWLSSDEDLISIRPKEPEDRRLNMNARQMNLVFYESVLCIPLLIVVAGVGVWWQQEVVATMKLARLLIAAVLLAGLAAALWWSNKSEDAKAKKPPKDARRAAEDSRAQRRPISGRSRSRSATDETPIVQEGRLRQVGDHRAASRCRRIRPRSAA